MPVRENNARPANSPRQTSFSSPGLVFLALAEAAAAAEEASDDAEEASGGCDDDDDDEAAAEEVTGKAAKGAAEWEKGCRLSLRRLS